MQPKKRWFCFHLSTWFVLVAMLCWAMAYRPYLADRPIDAATYPIAAWIQPTPDNVADLGFDWVDYAPIGLNPALLEPALALAAFFAWKALFVAVDRRRFAD